MDPLEQVDYGHYMYSDDIIRGLKELNSDLVFDPGGNHNLWHPHIKNRLGVYYKDQHVCGLDRGKVPEFKVRNKIKVLTELPWHDADKEDAGISYIEVLPTDPEYCDLYERGLRGNDPQYFVRPSDRKLLKCVVRGYKTVAHRIMRLGWRLTFERILAFGVPGVTRETLAKKFNVNMMKIPVGTPEELVEALGDE